MTSEDLVKCYVCEQYIVDGNTYDEHIVLNAMGGRLHSKNLLCRQCAPLFDKIDAQLAKHFNPIANLLNVRRHRGEPQPIRAEVVNTGEEIFLDPGGKPRISKPTIDIKEDNGEASISLTAKNEKQAREVLKGLKRKFPNLDIEKALEQAVKSEFQLDSEVHFSLEVTGDEIYRSVCKTAVNFYVYSRREYSYIKHLIPYLKGEHKLNCVQIYSPDYDFFPNFLEKGKVFHNLFVGGNSEERVLYAVVQFFSTFQFLILISDEYDGQNFFDFYFFDLIEVSEYRPGVEITHLPKNLILEILEEKLSASNHFQTCVKNLFKLIARKQHFERLISQAIKNALERHLGEEDSQKFIQSVINEIMEAFLPLIAKQSEILNQRELIEMNHLIFDHSNE
jgi:hypothetical protein